jgi:hypothetical protein
LAHAGPNIGVDEVGILDHRAYVFALIEIQIAHESNLFDKIVRDLVLFRASQTESQSTHCCGPNQRSHNVVSISYKRQLFSSEVTAGRFVDGKNVGQGLAWMGLIGQAIDRRDGVVADEFLDGRLGKSSADQEVAVLSENTNKITDGLTLAPPGIAGQVQSGTSQLRHGGFETNASPQTRLFEHQRTGSVFEQIRSMSLAQEFFELVRPVHDRLKFIDSQIDKRS